MGMDFLRIKGVIHIAGSDRRYVLQCVHMLRDENFTKPWGELERESRIIFIGRGMRQRRQELTDGVMECVTKPLRFEIGTRVMANLGDYLPGRIVKHWDECNAYRIELDDGDNIWAACDEDIYVMAA